MNNIRFYSTYEELKLDEVYSSYKCSESFYSTYEELKHISFIFLLYLNISFLQYLWGIETS